MTLLLPADSNSFSRVGTVGQRCGDHVRVAMILAGGATQVFSSTPGAAGRERTRAPGDRSMMSTPVGEEAGREITT